MSDWIRRETTDRGSFLELPNFEDGMEGEEVSLLLEEGEVFDCSDEMSPPWASESNSVLISCFAVT